MSFSDLYLRMPSLTLVMTALYVICHWKLFEKAGEPRWASLIPFYNLFVSFRIIWGCGFYFLLLLIPVVNLAVYAVTVFRLARRFGKGVPFGFGLLLLYPVFLMLLAFGDAEFAGASGDGKGCAYPPQGYPQNEETRRRVRDSVGARTDGRVCPNCGAPAGENARFCVQCGSRLTSG